MLNNEQLTEVAKEHGSEIDTLKEQVQKMAELYETILEIVQLLQKVD